MAADFTPGTYKEILKALQKAGYAFQTYASFIENPQEKSVVLRHDVDAKNHHALRFGQVQNRMGIVATYYFRITRGSWNPDIMKELASMGHEIGYHYEDIALVRKKRGKSETQILEEAYALFTANLDMMRSVTAVVTICSHGSPLSSRDNKKLWEHYDYKRLGIIAETYLDTDFSKTGYLTDTGRCWNGSLYNVRDKVKGAALSMPRIANSFQLINAIDRNQLPPQLMINFHPQRWTHNPVDWVCELVWQWMKNGAKKALIQYRKP